jgi:hypothetical protein
MSDRLERAIPWILAGLMTWASLRGIQPETFVFDSDASRHVLNGTMIYDFLRSGQLTHPVAFAKEYYSRFPAITIPYHPPLFPMVEALSFAVLGVNEFAARLPVAIAVGICAALMYKLAKYTHGSTWLAATATLCFFAVPVCDDMARDVMLEFPSLALALGALYCLRDLGDGFPASRAIPFAILSAAAVWTKQHAIFLGLVPFAFIVFRGNWRLLKQPMLWAASLFLGLSVVGLSLLSLPVNRIAATSQFAETRNLWGAIRYNIIWYSEHFPIVNGPYAGIVSLIAIAAFLAIRSLRRRPESHLYLAWILSLTALLLPLSQHDVRYFIYAMPAVLVLICECTRLACWRTLPARYAAVACGLLAACWIGYHATHWRIDWPDTPTWRLARDIKARSPRRLAYCGPSLHLHKLAMALRFTSPDSRTIVIRCDKLDPGLFAVGKFEEFIRRYGVDMVSVEPTRTRIPFDPNLHDAPWNGLTTASAQSMILTHVISTLFEDEYDTSVFAIKDPTTPGESSMTSTITNSGLSVEVNLE